MQNYEINNEVCKYLIRAKIVGNPRKVQTKSWEQNSGKPRTYIYVALLQQQEPSETEDTTERE